VGERAAGTVPVAGRPPARGFDATRVPAARRLPETAYADSNSRQSSGRRHRNGVTGPGILSIALPAPASASDDAASLSVTVITRNRTLDLRRALTSLQAQSKQPAEIVVSDDSDDSVAAGVEALAEEFGAVYVRGPRRGLYANRNHAALAARGTHIRTMDDDHELPAGNIAACQAAIEADPLAVWVMNEVWPSHRTLEQGRRPPPQLTPRGYSVTPTPGRPMWGLSDGAAIFPKAIFDRGERYSEAFPMGAAYLEFGSRLHWRGYRIRHLADTYVIHHVAERQVERSTYDVPSRIFAAWMHSYEYQRSWCNRAITAAEVLRFALCQPLQFWSKWQEIRRAVVERRSTL
jgi:glycosyltransferase involved in cell wall biosynthesis